ncbi:MAG: hypothetical protein AB1298_04030 [Bacteroidota bacterium]
MKVLLIILLLAPICAINAQKIGMLAPEKAPEVFPTNTWGVDIMFGEGGFGLGTFYRRILFNNITGFVDFSISETKDDREISYIDYFGNTFTPNKVNRSFLLPINFGIQYRLFSEALTENLRPYISFGVGPTIVVSTPYELEFFSSFRKARANYAAGGYIGFGANIGSNKSNLVGLNIRYYYTYIFGEGIENLTNQIRKNFGQFFLSLNIGIMY